jgi:hypothetical protein
MAQLVPFHASARLTWSPGSGSSSPAAAQPAWDEHETEKRELVTLPFGLGTAWMCQLLPFHASASATGRPLVDRGP